MAANPTVHPAFVVEPRSYDDADVVRLVAEVQQEYVVRYGGPDGAAVEAGEFALPHGLFLVGLLGGTAVATGAWRRVEEPGLAGAAEIKRMFVVRSARRRGLARLMLAELERSAAAAGVRRLVLNTGPAQPEAVALYESAGYEPVPSFGYYRRFPNALFYGKPV